MTTVYSTTGTAPIMITTGPAPGLVYVELEDGSEQVYEAADLAVALLVADPAPPEVTR